MIFKFGLAAGKNPRIATGADSARIVREVIADTQWRNLNRSIERKGRSDVAEFLALA